MAHLVESMFSVMEVPWHGLGTVLPEVVRTAAEAIKAAGLNWPVEKRPLHIYDGHGTIQAIKALGHDHSAMVRVTDDKVLGIVGPDYTPVQNVEAFNFFDIAAASKQAEYHTAGSLDGGRYVWILAQLPGLLEILPDDCVAKFLLLYHSHDGRSAVRIGLTPIRVVCANTLSVADKQFSDSKGAKNGGKLIAELRHVEGVQGRIVEVANAIASAEKLYEDLAGKYRLLAGAKMTAGTFEHFLNRVFPVPDTTDEEKDVLNSDHMKRVKGWIRERHENGAGSNIPGVKGSFWGAANAVAEYVDHERGNKQEARLRSLWFGEGQSIKSRSIVIATTMALDPTFATIDPDVAFPNA